MRLTLIAALLAAAGCGPGPAATADPAGLTVAEWKALPPAAKYDVDTLERLKQGDPALQDQRAWDKFARQVLLPAKKADGVK